MTRNAKKILAAKIGLIILFGVTYQTIASMTFQTLDQAAIKAGKMDLVTR